MERSDVQGAVQALKDPSTDLGAKVYEVLDHLPKGDPARVEQLHQPGV